MPPILPNSDQQHMLRAIGQVARRHVLHWEGTADVVHDLRTLGQTLGVIGDPPPAEQTRSFWGWGYEGQGPDPLMMEVMLAFFQERFGVEPTVDFQPPQIGDIGLRAPRFSLPESLAAFCTDDRRERISHSLGKAFRDIVRGLHGLYDNPTDYVAIPHTEDQIAALMRFCAEQQIALVPYGGGSSVCGGVEPTRSDSYTGTITLDMRRFDRLLSVDPTSRTARVQAGIFGPALEDALKPYGLSPRFYPQSFEFSTLGGWIATRAGGHYCTLYTHIDDILQSVRVVTPAGVHETRRLPASGAGPSQERLWLGSEGTLGVITEAHIRLHARPRFRSSATVTFPDFLTGAEAVRLLSQSKLYPVNCRLVSPLEAVAMGMGDGRHAVLLLGFESEGFSQKSIMNQALGICSFQGGKYASRKVKHTESKTVRSGSAGRWRRNFIKAPYIRDVMARKGMVTETFETAVTWDRLHRLHSAIEDAAETAFNAHCQGKGVLTCRFTHVYPDGPAPYYSVVAWSEPGRQIETWDAIKAAVSDAIIEHGGTITHHHAVGRDHRPWYERERGPLFTRTLEGLKNTLDPEWILNPGVLLAERERSQHSS